MREYTKLDICQIARGLGVPLPVDWHGPGPVRPLLESVMEKGAVVILKLDGERGAAERRFSVIAMECSVREDHRVEAMLVAGAQIETGSSRLYWK